VRFIIVSGVVATSLAPSSTAIADTVFSTQETRQIIYKYGACAVKHHAEGASKAVLGNVDSLTLVHDYSALIDRACLAAGARLAFPGDYYIYALADALVARVLATAPVPDLSNVPPLERRSMASFPELKRKFGYRAALQASSNAEIFEPFNEYGECVVRHKPATAKAFLMTEPETALEADYFQALEPAFSACAPEDKTIKVSKTVLRGTIALNYYRLAQAALHVPIH
jgi:hypothetical protein